MNRESLDRIVVSSNAKMGKIIQWYLDNEDWWKHIISGEYQNYFAEMYKDRL